MVHFVTLKNPCSSFVKFVPKWGAFSLEMGKRYVTLTMYDKTNYD